MKFSVFLIAIAIIFGLIHIQGADAMGLQYYGLENTINSDMSVRSAVTLKFSEPISHLEYGLAFRAENLSVDSKFTSDCELEPDEKRSVIYCDFVGMSEEDNLLELTFITNDAVKKINGNYQFNINYGISLPIERSFAIIKLPENGVLTRQPANESYYPPNGKIMTDGKHIMVYWQEENLTSGDSLQFSVLFSFPAFLPISGDSFLIAVLTILIIVSMIGIAVYVRRGEKIETVTSVLNEDEKEIVDILKRSGGKALQKILVRESGFSKAKVSRLVKNLKERGVVDIEPVSGRENRILLKINAG
jgi:uncharacterized membrane protein